MSNNYNVCKLKAKKICAQEIFKQCVDGNGRCTGISKPMIYDSEILDGQLETDDYVLSLNLDSQTSCDRYTWKRFPESGGGDPPGFNKQIIFNNNGVFGATPLLTVESSFIGSSSDIIPSSNNNYNLGSSSNEWNNVYTNSVTFDTTQLYAYSPGILVYLNPNNVLTSIVKSENIVYVRLQDAGPDEFTSIQAALMGSVCASASVNNPITVQVSPGVFTEGTITMLPYVTLNGSSDGATRIVVDATGKPLIVGADNAMICNVELQGIALGNSGRAAIYYSSNIADQYFFVENVKFLETDTLMICVGGSSLVGKCFIMGNNLKYGGNNSQFNTGFYATSDGSSSSSGCIHILNSTTIDGGILNAPSLIFALADKPGCEINLNAVNIAKKVGGVDGSIGVKCFDGASITLSSVYFLNWDTAVFIPNLGAAPYISAVAMNFVNSATFNVNIQHLGATGKIDGINNNALTFINQTCGVYIIDKDTRIITVALKGGDYSSIKDAVDSIVGASISSLYIVSVGPGIYIEDTITMKPYVNIVGSSLLTVIQCNAPNKNLIVGAPNSGLFDCVLAGTAGTGAAVYFSSGSSTVGAQFGLSNVRFSTNTTLAILDGSVFPSILTCFNVTFGGNAAFTNGFQVIGGSAKTELTLRGDNVISNFMTASSIIQGVKYVSRVSGNSPITITYSPGGTAGSEVVTVLVNSIDVQIQSGVSTNFQIITALLASIPASLLILVYSESTIPVISTSQGPTGLTLPANVVNATGINTSVYINSMNCSSGGMAGVFAEISDGVNLNCVGSAIDGFDKAFWIRDIGAPCNMIISGTNITNCNMYFQVDQPLSTGNYTGYVPFDKFFIISTSFFFITGTDPHIITVAKTGGDFTSIAAAVIAVGLLIPSPSLINRYLITVGPGIFIEPQIVMQPFISITGSGNSATIIRAANPAQHLILGCDNVVIRDCSFNGIDTTNSGIALIYLNTPAGLQTSFMGVLDCTFTIADILVWVDNTTGFSSDIIIGNCSYGGPFPFNYGFKTTTTGVGSHASIEIISCVTTGGMSSEPINVLLADGAGANIKAISHLSETRLIPIFSIFAKAVNGGTIELTGVDIEDFNIAIQTIVGGGGAGIIATGISFDNCNINLDIQDTSTVGYLIGYSEVLKTNIVNAAPFFIANKQKFIVTVASKGADFTSVYDALQYVIAQGDCSATTPYNITIGPGVFIEPLLDLTPSTLQYIMLMGNSIATTIIRADGDHDIILTGIASNIYNLQFDGSLITTPTNAAIKCIDQTGDGYLCFKCQFNDCPVGIYQQTTLGGVSTVG